MKHEPRVGTPVALLAAMLAAAVLGSCGGSDGPPSAPASPAVPGAFELAFGSGGIAVIDDPNISGTASARFVEVAPDSSLRVAGVAPRQSIFARWLPNGTPDPAMNASGYVLEGTGSFFDPLHQGLRSVALPGGRELRIEATHLPCFTGPSCGLDAAYFSETVIVRRLDANGDVDPTYGTGGEASVARLGLHRELPEPSGALVVAGIDAIGGMHVVRSTDEGLDDPQFAANASAAHRCAGLVPAEGRFPTGVALARQGDGKVLFAQTWSSANGPAFKSTCITRLRADGSLDTAFGESGRAMIPEGFNATTSPVALFALDNGGAALFLAMRFESQGLGAHRYMIATLDATGRLDASRFDGGITGPTDLHVARLTAVARQADGKYLVAGYPTIPADAPPYLADRVERYDNSQPRIGRLNATGGADLAFGPDGTGFTRLLSTATRLDPYHIHIGPNRGIFIAGAKGAAGRVDPSEATRFAVAKLAGDSPGAMP